MANRNQQKFGMEAVRRRMAGLVDPRGKVGTLSRGRNIYKGGSYAAQRGGSTKIGRPVGSGDVSPRTSSINRRMARRR